MKQKQLRLDRHQWWAERELKYVCSLLNKLEKYHPQQVEYEEKYKGMLRNALLDDSEEVHEELRAMIESLHKEYREPVQYKYRILLRINARERRADFHLACANPKLSNKEDLNFLPPIVEETEEELQAETMCNM